MAESVAPDRSILGEINSALWSVGETPVPKAPAVPPLSKKSESKSAIPFDKDGEVAAVILVA